jgi:hypothetical protein
MSSIIDRDSNPNSLKRSISISLDTYNDLFSDFDPRPYSSRNISDDFIEELKKVSLENEFSISEILLIIPVDFRNEETESIIIKRLHSFIKANYQYHNLNKNELIKKGSIFLLSGTLLLIGAGYISFLKLDDFISHLILVMLEPAGWFLTWNGLDLVFTGSYKSKSDLVFYSKILRSKISFNNL